MALVPMLCRQQIWYFYCKYYLVKQHFVLWPSLDCVFLDFSLGAGWWVFTVLVLPPCLRVRMGSANKGDFSSPAVSSWFFFSMEKNLFLSQKRPFLLHEKKQHEPSYKRCEGELNSPFISLQKLSGFLLVVVRSIQQKLNSEWGYSSGWF